MRRWLRRGLLYIVAPTAALFTVLIVLAATGVLPEPEPERDEPETVATEPESDPTTAATTEATPEGATTTTTEDTADDERAARCERFGQNVENYDVLSGSRKGYLILLHKFQRDCAEEARERGLDASVLPQCERLDQENCTMYRG
jgi:hypothetical protein